MRFKKNGGGGGGGGGGGCVYLKKYSYHSSISSLNTKLGTKLIFRHNNCNLWFDMQML